MRVCYKAGESVSSELMFFEFGEVVVSGGHASFGLHGFVETVPGYKKSTTGKPDPAERIECVKAAGKANTITVEKQKVPCGNHKCFEGEMRGRASARITKPYPEHL